MEGREQKILWMMRYYLIGISIHSMCSFLKDLGEFGISSRRIRQTKEFSTGSTLAWERGTTSTQSTVEGIFAKDLQVAIKPVS